jgi:uncharacterized protein with FMN-binding domain
MTDGGGMVPRKAAWASLITVVGLVLLFSFKTPGAASLAAANGATGDQAVVDSGGTPAATAAPTPAATSGTTTTHGDATSGTTSAATPAPMTTTTQTYQDGTYTGSTITTRYGNVEVQVTVSGGTITDVTALALPDRDNHSARISSQAAPILREEALTAQSANIDLLSGATYTSTGYEQSLQAALDQALA